MSNRHVEELQRVYDAVFQDLVYAYPALEAEFKRDRIRLRRALEQRGLHAPCVDLPALGKHLDRCLAEGQYMLSGLPLSSRMSTGVPIPKFLGGLYLLVFEHSGVLKGEDCDIQAILLLRQVLYLAKEASLRCSDSEVWDEVRSFAEVDDNLPEPEQFWHTEKPSQSEIEGTYGGFAKSPLYRERLGNYEPMMARKLSAFLATLDTVSSIVSTTLGPYSYGEWRFRHGPGAIAETTRKSNKYKLFNWSERLQSVFPLDDCGVHNATEWVDRVLQDAHSGLDPKSRMVAVPKTFTKPRLIACEPSEHQWCQQNIWHYLHSKVRDSWIGEFIWFNDQTRNQRLCLLGSMDGSLATVDLKAASDRVSCHIVGQTFRRNPGLLLALQATRTRFVEQDLAHDVPGLIPLKKFSTMGSTCTFPVETLIFFCVAISAVLTSRQVRPTLGKIRELTEQVTVFGDDMIVPVDCRELLFHALELLHFKLNVAKTFSTGRFRESCGVDAFRGHDVTPAKWKGMYDGKPEIIASMIDVSNNFYSKFFVHTSAYLDTTIQGPLWALTGSELPLVGMSSGFAGLRSFVRPPLPAAPKRRKNKWLQRKEFWLPQLRTVETWTETSDSSSLLQYFTEVPRRDPQGYVGVGRELALWNIHEVRRGYANYATSRIWCGWVPEDRLLG